MPQNDLDNKIYAPQYVTQFSCIGSACEDTCCAGWRVEIDQRTYRKYRNTKKPEVKELLDSNLKRNRNNPSEQNYAYIQMMEDGSCPLLTSEHLCRVHKYMGESALSHTCTVYPRRYNAVLGVIEETLTMSCPEAARLALLNKSPMNFVEIPIKHKAAFQLNKRVDAGNEAELEHYFANLRIFTIEILQNREYSISDRLILLGLAMRKVQDYMDSDRLPEIPSLLNSYAATIMSEALKGSLKEIPKDSFLQVRLMKAGADKRFESDISNRRYKECYTEFLVGLNITQGVTDEEIVCNYDLANVEYCQPFMKEHEYILENYMVNHALHSTFPLTDSLNVFQSYIALILPFAWLKLVLVGMAGYEKSNFDQNSVLKLIQSYTKVVEHNTKFKNSLISLLEEEGHDSMGYLSILIHD
jgi:lysine-N-methylase